MLLKMKYMSENTNSKLVADAWMDTHITYCWNLWHLPARYSFAIKCPVMPEYLLWSNYIFFAACEKKSLAVYEVEEAQALKHFPSTFQMLSVIFKVLLTYSH